jgi:hypothetical protein
MTHGVSRGALLDLGTVEWVAARHLRSRELYSSVDGGNGW